MNKHLDVYAGITYGRGDQRLHLGLPGTPGALFGTAGTGTAIDTTSDDRLPHQDRRRNAPARIPHPAGI